MKVIAISDFHGHLPKIEEEFDLMLIPGDICPVWNHSRKFQKEWVAGEFSAWVNSLPFKDAFSRVVMCAGNHDMAFENMTKSARREIFSNINDGRLIYLENEEYVFECPDENGEIRTYRIFATPYCKIFGNWAFMRENEKLDRYYGFIPDGCDFVISHDAADINDLGMILMGRYRGTNAGNGVLAEHIRRAKPKYYFCGHIHSGNHSPSDIGGTVMANVSIMDEDYNPTHFPLVLTVA